MAEERNLVQLTLSNGMKVEIDTSKANGHLLMKCRNAANGVATVIYLIAEIGTFDGEKLAAEEILNFSAFDIIDLEEAWAKSKK
ncbi:hypothetical protein IJE86_11500 [bacterium]|nr:hypothetical protein [bacterium]